MVFRPAAAGVLRCRNFLLYTTTPRIAAAAAKQDLAGVSKITAQGGALLDSSSLV